MFTLACMFLSPIAVASGIAWYFGRQADKRVAECVEWSDLPAANSQS